MKKLIVMTIALCMSIVSFADDWNLYIEATSTTAYKLSDVQKLTFQNGNVVVNMKDGTKQTAQMSAVSRMYFGPYESTYADEDVNKDGSVDSQDVLAIYEYMKNSGTDGSCDVNGDSAVDSQDVLRVYDYMKNH